MPFEYALRGRLVGALVFVIGLLAGGEAFARPVQSFRGDVTRIVGTTITVSDGNRSLEIECERLPKMPDVGDQITIQYELDAVRVERHVPRAQQPGEAAPTSAPRRKRRVPREKKHDLLDDRAFYDA